MEQGEDGVYMIRTRSLIAQAEAARDTAHVRIRTRLPKYTKTTSKQSHELYYSIKLHVPLQTEWYLTTYIQFISYRITPTQPMHHENSLCPSIKALLLFSPGTTSRTHLILPSSSRLHQYA